MPMPRLLAAACLILAALPVQAGKAPASGIDFGMVKDHRGFQVPHLIRYRNPEVAREVNRQIAENLADLGCSDDPAVPDKTLEVSSEVKLAADDIFSVYISARYFCGAFPENDDNRSLTFDLKTGKAVSFEELFRDYTKNRREILRTIFRKQVEKAERAAAAGKKDNGDTCKGSPQLYSMEALDEGTPNYFFNLTPRGLEVQPDWPHVIQACAVRVTVPYARLRQFAAPGGLLERKARR
jgi:hypothetical protein